MGIYTHRQSQRDNHRGRKAALIYLLSALFLCATIGSASHIHSTNITDVGSVVGISADHYHSTDVDSPHSQEQGSESSCPLCLAADKSKVIAATVLPSIAVSPEFYRSTFVAKALQERLQLPFGARAPPVIS
ncbi:hypothetical protein KFE80_11455 [bacterium SCSIO 12696]|nr:hypothetical protein KFE80_11455 [bacterium SCSIO 12696]